MKNIFLISILAFSHVVIAQQDGANSQTRLTAGLKAGVNISNIYDSEDGNFDADARAGLAAGGFVVIPLGRYIGLQPEILFSQKGFRGRGTFAGTSYELTRTTNYLDIPILFALKPVDFITILAGPQISYLISQNDRLGNNGFSTEQNQQFDNDDIRKNTVCFTGGLDININHFVISGRAGWDLFKNRGDGSSETPRYKNVWAQATIGFRL
jgi:hypothetical protein